MTPEQAAAVEVVRREFGEPSAVRFAETWGPRVVVEAILAGANGPEATVFVKAAGDADVFAERTTMGLARSAGVPVPMLLASGSDPALPGGRWIATAKAPGAPWAFDDREGRPRVPPTARRTGEEIAACFARLSRTHVPGFGPLSAAGIGRYASWPAWLRASLDTDLDGLAADSLVSKEFCAKARAVFDAVSPTIERGGLVHGDLGNGETFVDPDTGAVTCLVDWGAAVVGDPIYEFARFVAGGPADDWRPDVLLPMVLEPYLAETGIDRARVDRTLPLYMVHNAIFNAEWSHREGVPWVDDLLAKADRLLDQIRAEL